jgi:Aminotransferase class I and II
VRLAGAVPRLVVMRSSTGEWRVGLDRLRAAVCDRTRVVFLNNASFPTGWVASAEEWDAVAALCTEHDLWLLYWAGFEAVLYDGREVLLPAALPGRRERTVIVGAPSMEQRMIAWRVGWVVMPSELTELVSRAQIHNGLVASGFAQIGTKAALEGTWPRPLQSGSDVATRRCASSTACRSLPRTRPGRRCLTPRRSASGRASSPPVCSSPKVAAMAMDEWGGEIAGRHLGFVFSSGRWSGSRCSANASAPVLDGRLAVPTLADVLAARRRIAGRLRATPLFPGSAVHATAGRSPAGLSRAAIGQRRSRRKRKVQAPGPTAVGPAPESSSPSRLPRPGRRPGDQDGRHLLGGWWPSRRARRWAGHRSAGR